MKNLELENILAQLTVLQRKAVDWDLGAMFVLAGPGSGKTKVLTTRIARLLNDSPDDSFRVLALTFTNKAADEMLNRVLELVPEFERRIVIGTFHSFCMQLLQQHGSHIGIKPDFAIYSLDSDRKEILKDVMKQLGIRADISPYLGMIDKLKSRLILPKDCSKDFPDKEKGKIVEAIYNGYEAALLDANALDFGSLIANSYRLVSEFPGIGLQIRRAYRYWLFDEFQDTNDGQYRFVRTLAGDKFRNIFSVADDDQIIYQWNGASFQQIQRFRADYSPDEIQLPTNYRCPPIIVDLANQLVTHNQDRTTGKKPLKAGKTKLAYPVSEHVKVCSYQSEELEADGIAAAIAQESKSLLGGTAVLARNRALLENILKALSNREVDAAIAQRRDDFVSSCFVWLNSILTLLTRPLDKHVFETVVSAYNRWFDTSVNFDDICVAAELSSRTYFDEWSQSVLQLDGSHGKDIVRVAVEISANRSRYRSLVEAVLKHVEFVGENEDVEEDRAAWTDLSRAIHRSVGADVKLEQFLQELSMRSKEPPVKPNTVTLMTIHAAKGREFDRVFVAGLAEGILPSFQSIKAGDNSSEMEEERRNCFVAITRTRERLCLTYSAVYRGYRKKPSRFLSEMGLDSN
jgi:DNA helicase-2/ATP-dependent DNA helicase PcrA